MLGSSNYKRDEGYLSLYKVLAPTWLAEPGLDSGMESLKNLYDEVSYDQIFQDRASRDYIQSR